MAITSWKFANLCYQDASAGSIDWAKDNAFNPLDGNELLTDDDVFAGSFVGNSNSSKWLVASDFQFSVSDLDATSSVDGIEVELSYFRGGSQAVSSTTVKVVKGAVVQGTDFGWSGDWATSETVITLGGSTELGGLTILQSEVILDDFGIALALNWPSHGASPSSRRVFVDYVKIRLHHTPGAFPLFDPRKSSEFMVFFY